MNIYYENTLGNKVDFIEMMPLLDIDDLMTSVFDVTTKNNRITKFDKEITKFSINGDILKSYYDHIHDIFEYDVVNNVRGKLYINGYYLLCNIYGFQTKDFNFTRDYSNVTLNIISEYPSWIIEDKYDYMAFTEDTTHTFLDYPYDGNYDYSVTDIGAEQFINESNEEADFNIKVFGPVSNPTIKINEHEYTVNLEIGTGEYIEIDSVNKTVYLVQNDGTKINSFNYRKKDSYIFQKIASGKNDVEWNNTFNFSLVVYEKRGVPKWN